MCSHPDCQHGSDETARLATIQDHIATTGWANMGVLPEAGAPGYVYTVGLTLQGRPELIADGDPRGVVHDLVNHTARLLCDTDTGFTAGEEITTEFQGNPVTMRIGAPTKRNFRRAAYVRSLYSGLHRVRVLHLIPVAGTSLDQPKGDAR